MIKKSIQRQRESRQRFINAVNLKSPECLIATWFGSGLIIPASGTWGTLGGMIFGVPLLLLTNAWVVLITALLLFCLGLWCVQRIEKKLGAHDSSHIVIDEVVAILLCLSVLGNYAQSDTQFFISQIIIIFLLFRFFDAKKPLLVGWVDRKVKGALGVMLDDIVAAIFTIIVWSIIPFIIFLFIIPNV
jgi:phosphatidylglycerophosphatase A